MRSQIKQRWLAAVWRYFEAQAGLPQSFVVPALISVPQQRQVVVPDMSRASFDGAALSGGRHQQQTSKS
jgi:hypothetical protein